MNNPIGINSRNINQVLASRGIPGMSTHAPVVPPPGFIDTTSETKVKAHTPEPAPEIPSTPTPKVELEEIEAILDTPVPQKTEESSEPVADVTSFGERLQQAVKDIPAPESETKTEDVSTPAPKESEVAHISLSIKSKKAEVKLPNPRVYAVSTMAERDDIANANDGDLCTVFNANGDRSLGFILDSKVVTYTRNKGKWEFLSLTTENWASNLPVMIDKYANLEKLAQYAIPGNRASVMEGPDNRDGNNAEYIFTEDKTWELVVPESLEEQEGIDEQVDKLLDTLVVEPKQETVMEPEKIEPVVEKPTPESEVPKDDRKEVVAPVHDRSITQAVDGMIDALESSGSSPETAAMEAVKKLEQDIKKPAAPAKPANLVNDALSQQLSEALNNSNKNFKPVGSLADLKHLLVQRADQTKQEGTVTIKNIFNRSLSYFLTDFRKTNKIAENLQLTGTVIKRTRSYGIWDEGGATVDEGSVLIATTPQGKPLAPVFVHQTRQVVNGKHALVPLWPQCYVILGGHRRGMDLLAIYKVQTMHPNNQEKDYPLFDCSLVASYCGGVWTKHDTEDTLWTREHPAFQAAYNRIYEVHAVTPGYVCDYREHNFDVVDFNKCLQDQTLKIVGFNDITTAYKSAYYNLGVRVPTLNREQHALLTTYLVYYPEVDRIVAFLLGVIYDTMRKTSEGNRCFYYRVIMKEGDSFYYPDRTPEDAVSFDKLKEGLQHANGPMVTVFRRMTSCPDAQLTISYLSLDWSLVETSLVVR